MSVVTKQGDGGTTKLFSGQEVSKGSDRLECYGTLDELISAMGLARGLAKSEIKDDIKAIQKELFRLGAELATEGEPKFDINPLGAEDVKAIEALIAKIESSVKLPNEFIIPGDSAASGALDLSRTICRRLERILVRFKAWENKEASIYINRLSDLLFLMARVEESIG